MEQQEKNNIQRDEKFMRMAIDEARKALKEQEVPIGAVVVCGERVIGRGHNLVETLCDATAHAEMQSITAAASTLGGKYLLRIWENGYEWISVESVNLYRNVL